MSVKRKELSEGFYWIAGTPVYFSGKIEDEKVIVEYHNGVKVFSVEEAKRSWNKDNQPETIPERLDYYGRFEVSGFIIKKLRERQK